MYYDRCFDIWRARTNIESVRSVQYNKYSKEKSGSFTGGS